MTHATVRGTAAADTLLEVLGGTLVLIALALVALAFTVVDVAWMDPSPIVASTAVSPVALLFVARAVRRFVPRPA